MNGLDFWTLIFASKFNIKLYKVTSYVLSPVDVAELRTLCLRLLNRLNNVSSKVK